MKKVVTLFFVFSLSILGVSQQVDSWEKSTSERIESRKIKNNLYLSTGFLPFMGFQKNEFIDINEELAFRNYVDLYNLDLGLRYTLYKIQDFLSVGVSCYSSFGGDSDIAPILRLPLGITVSAYNNSCYNNLNKFGVNLTGGVSKTVFIGEYNWTAPFIRTCITYRKYKRNFLPKASSKSNIISGYFGIYYCKSNNINGQNIDFTSIRDLRLVFGRSFGVK